jgi:hypothetical protein
MRSEVRQLPTRFPVGTRYVIEGRGGHIRLRYLEFPDGRHVDLPADLAARTVRQKPRRAHSRRTDRRPRPKKI